MKVVQVESKELVLNEINAYMINKRKNWSSQLLACIADGSVELRLGLFLPDLVVFKMP